MQINESINKYRALYESLPLDNRDYVFQSKVSELESNLEAYNKYVADISVTIRLPLKGIIKLQPKWNTLPEETKKEILYNTGFDIKRKGYFVRGSFVRDVYGNLNFEEVLVGAERQDHEWLNKTYITKSGGVAYYASDEVRDLAWSNRRTNKKLKIRENKKEA